ncbi:ATP-binding protein [Lysobacter arenosi]|uniref:ATP-binding protein n=1 Tax=Lysobacter arenosi TaxID=2795387 RepID=A0ABX7R904_9GAMM|nr:ATP-binding protein [Lysobacter arenosi]QSX74603.1 ATP-binding protein [Lysobacter arenosi]
MTIVDFNSDDQADYDNVPPGASLLQSLRSVGYSLPTAVADIADNSIAAHARVIRLDFVWDGDQSCIAIIDDGDGMSETELREAMRPASRNPLEVRDASDLGRFGLGLKTASFSQCRQLCVISKRKGGNLAVRTWDLDYVADRNEWRLLKVITQSAKPYADVISGLESGTAVVWGKLDRVVNEGTGAQDPVGQTRFHAQIEEVEQHLGLTYHKFIEAKTLRISVNGSAVRSWNPYLDNALQVIATPIESIEYRGTEILFQGFVLPHKDKLTNEEFERSGGPNGWNAQQGFYVYRNGRLLLCGDWLGLGSPTRWTIREEFRLARISIEIGNTTDADWHLDVKKSTARPPAIVRPRLTHLAETVRERARSVFVHRGRYGKRAVPKEEVVRPWHVLSNGSKSRYVINRSHPLVASAISSAGQSVEFDRLFRLLEQTIPIQQIWLDAVQETTSSAYDDVSLDVIRSDLRCIRDHLEQSGLSPQLAISALRNIEPFMDFPKLIKELEGE